MGLAGNLPGLGCPGEASRTLVGLCVHPLCGPPSLALVFPGLSPGRLSTHISPAPSSALPPPAHPRRMPSLQVSSDLEQPAFGRLQLSFAGEPGRVSGPWPGPGWVLGAASHCPRLRLAFCGALEALPSGSSPYGLSYAPFIAMPLPPSGPAGCGTSRAWASSRLTDVLPALGSPPWETLRGPMSRL